MYRWGFSLMAVALLTVILLNACSSEDEKKKDARCIHNIKKIMYDGLAKFADEHDNKFPDTIFEVYKKKYINDLNIFSVNKTYNSQNKEYSKEQFNKVCDYIYVGKGKKVKGPDDHTILLVDKYDNHKNFVHILFANARLLEFPKEKWKEFCKRHNIKQKDVSRFLTQCRGPASSEKVF